MVIIFLFLLYFDGKFFPHHVKVRNLKLLCINGIKNIKLNFFAEPSSLKSEIEADVDGVKRRKIVIYYNEPSEASCGKTMGMRLISDIQLYMELN